MSKATTIATYKDFSFVNGAKQPGSRFFRRLPARFLYKTRKPFNLIMYFNVKEHQENHLENQERIAGKILEHLVFTYNLTIFFALMKAVRSIP